MGSNNDSLVLLTGVMSQISSCDEPTMAVMNERSQIDDIYPDSFIMLTYGHNAVRWGGRGEKKQYINETCVTHSDQTFDPAVYLACA